MARRPRKPPGRVFVQMGSEPGEIGLPVGVTKLATEGQEWADTGEAIYIYELKSIKPLRNRNAGEEDGDG